MKLAVYAIAKNEIKHVDRWVASVKDADEIIVLDTGSTDGTQERLKGHGIPVFNAVIEPFRFDTARNAALNLVSLDADYCMFIDLDETMPEGSIVRIKESIAAGDVDMYGVRLVYSFDAQRKPTLSYLREAIHRRNGFYWQYPVHELLTAREENTTSRQIDVDVYHEPDNEKSRAQYLPLLEKALDENPDNPRYMQYLGREYFYLGRYFDALMYLQRHVATEPHGPFRSESARYISQCFVALNDSVEEALDEAEAWLYRACAEHNSAREPFCDLAHLYYSCGEYESAIGAVRSALRITKPPTTPMLLRDELYRHWPYHMLAVCYRALGYRQLAQENIQLAMMNAAVIDKTLANDIATILGLHDASQSIPGAEATQSGQGNVPEDGVDGTKTLSGGVSEE